MPKIRLSKSTVFLLYLKSTLQFAVFIKNIALFQKKLRSNESDIRNFNDSNRKHKLNIVIYYIGLSQTGSLVWWVKIPLAREIT